MNLSYQSLIANKSNIVIRINDSSEIFVQNKKVFVWDEIFTEVLRSKNYNPTEVVNSKVIMDCSLDVSFSILSQALEQISRLPIKTIFHKNIKGYSNDVVVHKLPETPLKSWVESSIVASTNKNIKFELKPLNGEILEEPKNKLTNDKKVFDKFKKDLYGHEFDSFSKILNNYSTSKVVLYPNQKISLNGNYLPESDIFKIFELYWNNQVIFILFDDDIKVSDYLFFLNSMQTAKRPEKRDQSFPGAFVEISNSLQKKIEEAGLKIF